MKKPENIVLERNGDILTLRIDLAQTVGKTKSGANVLVATTRGNLYLQDTADHCLVLSLYRPIPEDYGVVPDLLTDV